MKKKVYIFLFNGFSDWEIAFLTPELQKSEKVELNYFSIDGKAVTSMGGLDIQPALSLYGIDTKNVDMLILPGGNLWETALTQEINSLTNSLFVGNKGIAAICAATTSLGRLGALDNVQHTSNDINYLKKIAPHYRGDENYQNQLAVSDKNIITANGIGPIEFAKEIFIKLELHSMDYIEKWFQLFKNGVWVN